MGWKHTQTPIKDKPLLPTLMIVNTQTKELPGKSHPKLALNQERCNKNRIWQTLTLNSQLGSDKSPRSEEFHPGRDVHQPNEMLRVKVKDSNFQDPTGI